MSHSIEPWIAILKQRQTQLLVTGVALFVYFGGFHIPLPFMPQEMASNVQLAKPFSVFALGQSSWVYSVSVAELLLLIFPRLRKDSRSENRHANPFGLPIVAFALVISFFQGFGIADSMAALARSPSTTSFLSLFPAAISLTAGVAIVIALAGLIERSGIGMGFWVMLVASAIFGIARDIGEISNMLADRSTTFQDFVFWALASVLSITLMVYLIKVRQSHGREDIGSLLWPLIVAETLLGPILMVLQYILPKEWQAFLSAHFGIYFALHGVLVLVFVFIYSRDGKFPLLNWLTLLAMGLLLFLGNAYLIGPFPRLPLSTLALVLFSYACVMLFNEYTDNRRKIALAQAFRPRKYL